MADYTVALGSPAPGGTRLAPVSERGTVLRPQARRRAPRIHGELLKLGIDVAELSRSSSRTRRPQALEGDLDKLKFHPTADGARSAGQCFQCHGVAFRVEKPVELAPTGLHPPGHLRLGEVLLLHCLLDLPGENPLDRDSLGR